MIRIECSDGSTIHDSRRVEFGFYDRHHHRWFDTDALKCRICGAKMVPEDWATCAECGVIADA